jgi:hypothetical protein
MMPRFVCKSSVTHDGKEYLPGEVVELSEAQAAAMPWAVEPASSPEEKPRGKGK